LKRDVLPCHADQGSEPIGEAGLVERLDGRRHGERKLYDRNNN
jgi:hypothetical protein